MAIFSNCVFVSSFVAAYHSHLSESKEKSEQEALEHAMTELRKAGLRFKAQEEPVEIKKKDYLDRIKLTQPNTVKQYFKETSDDIIDDNID